MLRGGLNGDGRLERRLVWVVQVAVPLKAFLLLVILFAVLLAVLLPATEGDVEFHSCALPPLLHPPGPSTRPGLARGLDQLPADGREADFQTELPLQK